MANVIYNLSELLPYFIVFPIIIIILYVILIILSKRKITEKNAYFSGIFLNITNKEIFMASLILTFVTNIFITIFYNNLSIYNLIFIFIPILIYSTINMNIIDAMVNALATIFLFVLCFFEKIFLYYLMDITVVWYVVVLAVVLMLFIILFNIYIFMRNLYSIVRKSNFQNKAYFKSK